MVLQVVLSMILGGGGIRVVGKLGRCDVLLLLIVAAEKVSFFRIFRSYELFISLLQVVPLG